MTEIEQIVLSFEKELIEMRKYFHMHPELPGEEVRTSKIIYGKLREYGLRVQGNMGGYGVVGILEGRKKKPVVAWRADIDAIPLNDELHTPYKSRNPGVKHVCKSGQKPWPIYSTLFCRTCIVRP